MSAPPALTRARALSVFLFYQAISVVLLAPLSLEPGTRAANDGDPLHISWILAWDVHQLTTNPFRLFHSNTFYPYRNSLAFSDHQIVQALLAGPAFLLSGNALLAQNLVLLFTLAFAALAMFLLARETLQNEDAALVAGLIYAFNSFNLHEIPRVQVLSVGWWPLALFFLHRASTRGGFRNAALFGLFFLLQSLACIYYLPFFTLALVWWLPGLFLVFNEKRDWRGLAQVTLPLTAAGALVGIVALPYLEVAEAFGYHRPLVAGSDLLDYLRPPEGSVFSRWIEFPFEPHGGPQFLGLLPIGLALVGVGALLTSRRMPGFVGLSLVTAGAGLVLSAGPTIEIAGRTLAPGPYTLLYETLPVFRVLRSPERFSVLVRFGLAVLAACGVAALLHFIPRRLQYGFRVALLLFLPLEHWSGGQSFAPIPAGDRTPAVYRWLGEKTGEGPVVELPLYPREQLRRHSLYMFYSTHHWRPILFGRASFYPPLVAYLAWELRDFPDRDSLGLLRSLGVETIVVHPALWLAAERGEKLRALNAMADELTLLARFPALAGADYERLGLGDERVYRLVPRTESGQGADLCTPADEIAPDAWSLRGSASTPTEWALDRDPTTRWETHGQLPGDFLLIDLGRTEELAAIRLPLGYPYDEFPRHLVVRVRREEDTWQTVPYRNDLAVRVELARALVASPRQAALTLRFGPRPARYVRLVIRGARFDYALPDWAVSEMHLYRSCR